MRTACLRALKHLTKTPRVPSRTPSLIDPKQPDDRSFLSRRVSGQLKPNSKSGRQAKITPFKVGRACLEFVGLKPPPEQPHQSEIDSHPEIFSKGGIRHGCCRAVFARVYGADQGLCKRSQPSNRCSASQTEQEISLVHSAVQSAEISNHPKIAEVLFLYSCIPAIQVRTPS